jgi:uncharacterized membrane protein YeaQ/YmgE (transglycosylase-associated protein family)
MTVQASEWLRGSFRERHCMDSSGLVAGVLAKMLMQGKDPGGFIVTILIGIAGAVIGGFLWNLITGNDSYGDFDIGGILIAIVGSMILLWGYRTLVARRA